MFALTKGSNKFVAVTKSDTVPLSYNSVNRSSKGFVVGVGGNLVLKNSLGDSITIVVLAGYYYPFEAAYVMAATTATGIVAFF